MHTPMFAEPLVAAALEAAAEDAATEEAAVEVLEEPPQAVRPSAAALTPAAFRKERREMDLDMMISPSTNFVYGRRLVQAALPLMALVYQYD